MLFVFFDIFFCSNPVLTELAQLRHLFIGLNLLCMCFPQSADLYIYFLRISISPQNKIYISKSYEGLWLQNQHHKSSEIPGPAGWVMWPPIDWYTVHCLVHSYLKLSNNCTIIKQKWGQHCRHRCSGVLNTRASRAARLTWYYWSFLNFIVFDKIHKMIILC